MDELRRLWNERNILGLRWPNPFVSPAWIDAWKETLGADADIFALSAWEGQAVLGALPLMIHGDAARFAGDPDIFDYFDAVVIPGAEEKAASLLLEAAHRQGLPSLDLGPVRPDSFVHTHLTETARSQGLEVFVQPEAVTVEMELPDTWDGYLQRLSGKQRHEVRRKMRRLEEAGAVSFRIHTDPHDVERALPVFFELFKSNRRDKAGFLTQSMRSYFQSLCRAMSREGMVRLSLLELDGRSIAGTLCLDDGKVIYLYNNGYDAAYGAVSAGWVSKVFTIRDAVELGRERYEFLRGDEVYKFRLGGGEVQLFRVRIHMRG
ncbi:Acetyltransferase involved in cellulose biosynthesis, CelD/BcsL family [Desulfacinum hydrothermale DSM 13146]|uniref:Acetyltransferase involved in cellulose biosynthesis, CelD/BcsL family n=1 Tax=Desulfacinum hydrothermale DSM 13146 TaxID=1121390 RepID=A0A1W1XDR6_9BACT|nr:Acetyltransferase involved in cellulose biosynthesis, CelD/BcsL family [Desulfacinum hydrothermale DSM 13146]